MSTRAMAQHYANLSGRGRGESLDLFGIRERRGERQANAELERQKILLQLIEELSRGTMEKEAGLKETSAQSESLRKVADKYGVTAEQYKAIADDVVNNVKTRLNLETKTTGKRSDFLGEKRGEEALKTGEAARLSGIQFGPLDLNLKPDSKTLIPSSILNQGDPSRFSSIFGPMSETTASETGESFEIVNGQIIKKPSVQTMTKRYTDRPDTIPFNPEDLQRILMQGGPPAPEVLETKPTVPTQATLGLPNMNMFGNIPPFVVNQQQTNAPPELSVKPSLTAFGTPPITDRQFWLDLIQSMNRFSSNMYP